MKKSTLEKLYATATVDQIAWELLPRVYRKFEIPKGSYVDETGVTEMKTYLHANPRQPNETLDAIWGRYVNHLQETHPDWPHKPAKPLTKKQRKNLVTILSTRVYVQIATPIFERVEAMRKGPEYQAALKAFKQFVGEIRAIVEKSPYNPGDILHPSAVEIVFQNTAVAWGVLKDNGYTKPPEYSVVCKQVKRYLRQNPHVLTPDSTSDDMVAAVPGVLAWLADQPTTSKQNKKNKDGK